MTDTDANNRRNCPLGCNKLRLGTDDATGFFYARSGMGPIIVSNLFLSASLITLARKEIGCYTEDDDIEIECGKVYGFKPSSLITIIATITGVLGAFFLPVVGSIVDFTPHRHKVGILFAFVVVAIQAIQIFTVQSTWFPMSVLQSINGFIYMLVNVAIYSYSPEIARSVGEETFNWYSSLYFITMFGHEIVMIIIMFAVTIVVEGDTVKTAQFGQAFDVVVTGTYFFIAWYFLSRTGSKRQVPEGSTLLGAGFKQVFTTAKGIYDFYPRTVGFFFVAVIFADAAVASFTTVAVTYVTEVLNFNATQLAIIFIAVLTGTIPGCFFSNWFNKKTNPLFSVKLNLITFLAINFAGFLSLTDPSKDIYAYIAGAFWGFWIGWFYSVEFLIYGSIVPSGQEGAMSGLFLYCTQILTWGPPLVFTVMNEANVSLKWAGVSLNIWFFLGFVFFHLMKPWDECMEDAKTNKMLGGKEGAKMVEVDQFSSA